MEGRGHRSPGSYLPGAPGPPESGRARKEPPLEPLEAVQPWQHLGFRLPAPRTLKKNYFSAILSHQVGGNL